jgi:hypothetical protein
MIVSFVLALVFLMVVCSLFICVSELAHALTLRDDELDDTPGLGNRDIRHD